MRRTQISLTDEQERLLTERAAAAGVGKAEMIRRILDQAFGLDDRLEARRQAILSTAGTFADEDDWPTWLDRARGDNLEDRLSRLRLRS